jgi:hypothetical protein
MRDRESLGAPDSVLSTLDHSSMKCGYLPWMPSGSKWAQEPNALLASHRHVLNLALWLAGSAS